MDNNFQFPKILVGVAGGSASGKSTLCDTIQNEMKVDKQLDLLIVQVDSFQFGIRDYKGPIEEFDFDHPSTIDWDLLIQTIEDLRAGKSAKIPAYDFALHKRVPEEQWTVVESRETIFLEGIFALYHPKLRKLMNYKIFIDCFDDIRLCRRVMRDIRDRGRDVVGVLRQYNTFVKQAFTTHILPTKRYADIVVPGFKDNKIAINLLVQQLKHQAKELTALKTRMVRHLVFFGDILHDIQICVGFFSQSDNNEEINYLSVPQDSLQRNVFFTNDNQRQQELIVFIKYFAKGLPFTMSQFEETLKILLKYSFYLLESALHVKNIQINDVEAIPFNGAGLEHDKEKSYKVVVIPFLMTEVDKTLLNGLIENARLNKTKVIIVNLFGHIENIMDAARIEQDGFAFLINIFIVASRQKFYQHLQNVKDGDFKEENQIFQTSLFEKQKKYLQKRQNKS